MSSWLDAWELKFYRRSVDEEEEEPEADRLDQTTLVNLRALTIEFKRCVSPLDAPHGHTQGHWFDQVSLEHQEQHLDEMVDGTLRALDQVGDRIRGAFDLLNLQLSQAQDRRTKKLQDLISKITGFIVVPALVAGFFGANTWLPGGNSTHAHISFFIMVAAMAIGIFITWQVLKRHEQAYSRATTDPGLSPAG